MATVTWYLTATTGDGWRTLSETAQPAVTNADGWVVGTGATLHSEYQVGVERSTFTGTTVPDGTLDTTLKDAFRSPLLDGTFASGTWTFTFVVRGVTTIGTQNGRIRFRVIKANADGSGATEITSAQQLGSLTGAIASAITDYLSSATLSVGALTFVQQYLFIQLAWERTAAGGMSSADVNWRTGSSASLGTRIVTTDYTPYPVIGGAHLGRELVLANDVPTGSQFFGIQGLSAGTGFQLGGQDFPAPSTFDMDQVHLGLFKQGTPTDNVQLELCTTSMAGPVVATAALVPVSGLPATINPRVWSIFTFPFAVALTSGVQYFLRLSRTGARDAVNYAAWAASSSSVISSGTAWQFGAADTWTTFPTNDGALRLWQNTNATCFAPTVTPAGASDQAVTGTTIAAGSTLTEPTVVPAAADQAVTAVAVTAGTTVTAPTVTPGAVTITSATLASGAGTFAPTLTPSVLPSTITSTAVLFAPLVIPTQAITTATIAATSGPSAPTLASALTAATRVSTATLFAPSVVSTQGVTTAAMAAGSVLFAPALAGRVRTRHFGYIMTTS